MNQFVNVSMHNCSGLHMTDALFSLNTCTRNTEKHRCMKTWVNHTKHTIFNGNNSFKQKQCI